MKLVAAFGRFCRRLFGPPKLHPVIQPIAELRAFALAHCPEVWADGAGMPVAAALRKLGARYGIEIPYGSPIAPPCRAIQAAMAKDCGITLRGQ